ncbi:hypothetical protein [Photobacterium leiognathi]|uniref:hypothetical protein n=1 Tax=Photobacterium leiognathi TaxID=553611 RepID=UPI000D155D8A|nr:hypothetical protein [Photobacterium leiognathi]PSW58036.1 hypothetical protein C0W50_04595 [Photobacterium leiognathi subsp. mandapamensis]
MNLMVKLKEIQKRVEENNIKRKEIFTEDFLDKFQEYIFFGIESEEIFDNEKLFMTSDDGFGIKKIFENKDEIRSAENERFNNNSLYKVYYFNNPDGVSRSIRIDVVVQNKETTQILKDRYKDVQIKSVIDIEFFERLPIEVDNKNQELEELLLEYLHDPQISLEDIDEIESILALRDVEKFHMTFIVDDKGNIYPIYLGIGSNQPFSISEKSDKYGKERYYRYSTNSKYAFEQSSKVTKKTVVIPENTIIFRDCTSDGNDYALLNGVGVIVKSGSSWHKAIYEPNYNDLSQSDLVRTDGLDFIMSKIDDFFPNYEHYLQVKFDPLEVVKRYGHRKSAEFLYSKGLLGAGYQQEINVASDLFMNGLDDMHRLKPSILLIKCMIRDGTLRQIITKGR